MPIASRNKVTFVLNLYQALKLSRGGYARIMLYAKIACDIMQSRRRRSHDYACGLCIFLSLFSLYIILLILAMLQFLFVLSFSTRLYRRNASYVSCNILAKSHIKFCKLINSDCIINCHLQDDNRLPQRSTKSQYKEPTPFLEIELVTLHL